MDARHGLAAKEALPALDRACEVSSAHGAINRASVSQS